jgi:hemerythrin superfamily protein
LDRSQLRDRTTLAGHGLRFFDRAKIFVAIQLEVNRMNAISLLKKQHKEVEKLFKKYERMDPEDAGDRVECFEEIADKLAAHADIEEKYFYPASKLSQTAALLEEAVQDHLKMKRLIASIMEHEDPSSEEFDTDLKELKTSVLDHVDKEEKQLMPKVRKLLTKQELEALGEEMEEEFERLIQQEPRREVPSQTQQPASLD